MRDWVCLTAVAGSTRFHRWRWRSDRAPLHFGSHHPESPPRFGGARGSGGSAPGADENDPDELLRPQASYIRMPLARMASASSAAGPLKVLPVPSRTNSTVPRSGRP